MAAPLRVCGYLPCILFERPTGAGDLVGIVATITFFWLFEFYGCPLALKAQTFQRFMDLDLLGMPFWFVYLDDLLVANP